MKKRLLAITAILVAVVGAIVIALSLLPARHGVTKANFDRLEIGMSLNQVEAVFGRPGAKDFRMGIVPINVKRTSHSQAWQGAGRVAIVDFNGNGMVESMDWGDQPNITYYQKLQRLFPWLPD